MSMDGKKRFFRKKITIENIARAPAGIRNIPFRTPTGAFPCHGNGFLTMRKSPFDTTEKAFRQNRKGAGKSQNLTSH